MAFPYKLLFKGGGVLTQVADALIWPDEAGFGSDVVRSLDETVGDPGYLRKLQVTFTRGASGLSEDVAVCTFDLAKVVSEDFVAWNVTPDLATCEARFNTWWAAVKAIYRTDTVLSQYRWYKSGPAFPVSGPPVRITTPATPGTVTTATTQAPPQCAIDVSEHTRLRKHWGRFYLPAPAISAFAATGRLSSANVTMISTATVALYNGLKADGFPVVVYSRAKPERKAKSGATLPPQPARAYLVEELKVDDIIDVIRRRRYDKPVNFVTTVLT
jgi:hypothetical protein